MACTWEGDAGVGEFVLLLLLSRRRCRRRLTGNAGGWCGLLLCTVEMSECDRNDSLTPKVSSLMFLYRIWLCTNQWGDTGWVGLRGYECFFSLCNKGKVASLSLFFCHHSGVLLTDKVLLVEMNMHWAVTVSTWASGQSGPLYPWRIWPPWLDTAYSSSYAILNIEVYNIGYILLHFWNSRWVAWIRRCLQDIAKKVLGCKRPKH